MAFRAWLVEHRFRNIAIAVVMTIAGMFAAGFGAKQWARERTELGTSEVLGDGINLVQTAGFIAWESILDEDHTVLHVNGHDIEGAWPLSEEATAPNWQAKGHAIYAGSRRLVPGGWLDLRTGDAVPAHWNTSLSLQGSWGEHVYLLAPDGSLWLSGLDSPAPEVRLPPLPCSSAAFRLLPWEGGTLLACGGSKEVWELDDGEGAWQQTAFPSPDASIDGDALWDLEGATVFMLSGGRPTVLDLLTASTWQGTRLDGETTWTQVDFDGQVWVVGGLRTGAHFLATDLVAAMGDPREDGREWAIKEVMFFDAAFFEVAAWNGDLVYVYGGEVRIANPGSVSWPAMAMATLGGLATLMGLAWYPLQRARLQASAAGGTRRCLHCGAKRVSGIAFCPNCGWRTAPETAGAEVPMDPWDKDR